LGGRCEEAPLQFHKCGLARLSWLSRPSIKEVAEVNSIEDHDLTLSQLRRCQGMQKDDKRWNRSVLIKTLRIRSCHLAKNLVLRVHGSDGGFLGLESNNPNMVALVREQRFMAGILGVFERPEWRGAWASGWSQHDKPFSLIAGVCFPSMGIVRLSIPLISNALSNEGRWIAEKLVHGTFDVRRFAQGQILSLHFPDGICSSG
jgi:hypothetical protein